MEIIYDLRIIPNGPISEVQYCQNPRTTTQEALFLANMLSLPHLLARKRKYKKLLVDYDKWRVITCNEYTNR